MENVSQTWPVLLMILMICALVFGSMALNAKILVKELQSPSKPFDKKLSRIKIFEAAYIMDREENYRAYEALSAVIDTYGMENLKWGHLYWAYDQLKGSPGLDKKNMPNADGF